VHRLVASSFGLGLIPRQLWHSDSGAGTFGAALSAAIGAAVLTTGAPWWIILLLAAVATAASLWSAAPFAENADPGWVCMDETAGTLIALVGLSSWWPWVAALVVARAADISKVLPGIKAAERLPGSIGVTADDTIAGLYGLATGWLLTGVL
jgi:phosphatidylglycerophosphatase A